MSDNVKNDNNKKLQQKNYKICGARKKSNGEPCQRPAGWGTDHAGVGKCKLHGGASVVKHGFYSKYSNHRLAKMIDKISNDEDLLDLRKTIALQQSLILNILEKLEDDELNLNPDLSKTLNTIADKLGKNIQRRQKVEEGEKYILQVEEVQQVVQQIVLIIKKEVHDQKKIDRITAKLGELKW